MRFFVWLLRAVVFIIFLGLALTNTQQVQLVLAGYVWQAPLILIGLAFFLVGLLAGWLFTWLSVLPQQLEIGRLKRELKHAQEASSVKVGEEVPPLPPLA